MAKSGILVLILGLSKKIQKHKLGTFLKNAVFWDVTPCEFIINRRFGGTCQRGGASAGRHMAHSSLRQVLPMVDLLAGTDILLRRFLEGGDERLP
jgi:hypothetical protein